VLAAAITIVFTTWKKGREELRQLLAAGRLPLGEFLADLARHGVSRVRGTAVFMTLSPEGVPPILLHHVKHNHMLHDHVVLLTIRATDVPAVADDERVHMEELGQGFFRLTATYGYMENPSIPKIMQLAAGCGLRVEPNRTSFYLGRESLLTTGRSKMMHWRKTLFAFMSRNATNPTIYFGIPPNRVIELGAQVKL
jgi:KUP system potassium uptake protein